MKHQNQIGGFLDKIPCDVIVELAHFYLNSDDYKSLRIINKYLKRCLKEEAKIKGTNIKSVKQEREKRDRQLVKRDPYEIVNIHHPSKSVQSIAFNKFIILHSNDNNKNKIDPKTTIIVNNFNKIKEFYQKTKRPEEIHKEFGDKISFGTKEIMSRESQEETKKKINDRKKIYRILEKFIEDVKKQNKLFLENTIGTERKLISSYKDGKHEKIIIEQIQSRIRGLEPYFPILIKMSPKIKSAFLFSLFKKQHKNNLDSYDTRLSIIHKLQTMIRATKQRMNQDQIDEKIASQTSVKRIHTGYDPQKDRHRVKVMKAPEQKQTQRKKTKMTIKPPIKPPLNRVDDYKERQRWLAERRQSEIRPKRPREKTREKTREKPKEKKRSKIVFLPPNDN